MAGYTKWLVAYKANKFHAGDTRNIKTVGFIKVIPSMACALHNTTPRPLLHNLL